MDNKQIDEKEKKNASLIDVNVRRGSTLLNHDTQKIEPQKSSQNLSSEPVAEPGSAENVNTDPRSSVGEMNELVKIIDEKKKAEEQLKVEAEKLEKIEQLIAEKKYFIETKKQKSSMFAKMFIVFLLVGLVGFGGYIFLQKSKETTSVQNTTANTVANTQSNSELFSQTSSVADFSIMKKSGWKYDVTEDKDTGYFALTIVTAQGKQIKAHNFVGKGGDCAPNTSDKPHNTKNSCATYEELSYEKTKAGYLVRVKYTGNLSDSQTDTNMKTTYHYCLRSSTYLEKEFTVNKPVMGFYLVCGPSDLALDFGADVDTSSLAFFDNEEVKEVATNLLSSSLTLKNN